MNKLIDEKSSLLNQNIKGYVDYCDYQRVSGWVADFSCIEKHLSVKILIDDKEVCQCVAKKYRKDLFDNPEFKGICHAYNVKVENYFMDGKTHQIKVIESETGNVLGNSPTSVTFPILTDKSKEPRLDLALVGKDGWLFLCNDSNDAIGQYTGKVKLTHYTLDHYTKHYRNIQENYRNQEIHYMLTIVPGKESLYAEFLPESVINIADVTVKEQFIKTISSQLDIAILDLMPVLQANKSRGQLYYKNDSHWNFLGAMIASKKIIDDLRDYFPEIPEFNEAFFTLIEANEGICDLNTKTRLDYIDGKYIENNKPYDISLASCAVGLQYDGKSIEILEHPYKTLSKTRPTQLFKNEQIKNSPRAIIIRDSFADKMIPFLTEYFSECLFVWARYVDNSIVESFKPDIIIEEVVDRFLIENRVTHFNTIQTEVNEVNSKQQQISSEILKPVLYGISSYIPDAPFLNADELASQSGLNTGNLLFCHALSRILNASPVAIPWGANLSELSSKNNRIVIPMANFLGSHVDLSKMVDMFKTISVPIVGVGLGTQGTISGFKIDSVPQGSWDWLKLVTSKSATDYPNLSLRGQTTYDAIASQGLAEKCVITGCPSNFINPSNTLGREIYRRRANGIRRVVALSGSPYLPELKTVEQSLVKLVERTDGLYVCQHPLVTLNLYKQEYSNISKPLFNLYKDYIHPSLTDDEFMQWFRRWSHAFTSVPEWLSIMQGFDVVVGTRIHGVMAGIQAGVPSVCLCIDSRTLELCQTMMIPYVKADDYLDGISIEQINEILGKWNWRAFDENRFMLAERFIDFFRKNQLDVYNAPKEIIKNRKSSTAYFEKASDNATHQVSTASHENRYPKIFNALANSVLDNSSLKILSYGCSDGYETLDLARNYFHLAQIVGCDIDKEALRIAKKHNPLPSRISYIESNQDELLKNSPFDIITCMAVLCRWPETRLIENCEEIYSFEKFSETIEYLTSLLSDKGILCVYNSNYLVSDTKLIANFEVINDLFLPNSQQVRLFKKTGEPFGHFDEHDTSHFAQKAPENFSIIFRKISK